MAHLHTKKTGGVNITRQKWYLPSLQIYSSVLTILQHIYRAGQICENPIFRPVQKHYVIIACCEDIYGPYCIQKINNDHFLPLSAIIIFKMKNSLFSVVWNKQTRPQFLAFANCFHLFDTWKTTWHCFYFINPFGRTKMAGIVNKVYFLPVLSRVSGVEVVGCEDGRRGFLQKPDKKNTSVESVGILGSMW